MSRIGAKPTRRVGTTILLRQIDGPLFVLLLVSKNAAKESACIFIACFNNKSDRAFHEKILARNGTKTGKIL